MFVGTHVTLDKATRDELDQLAASQGETRSVIVRRVLRLGLPVLRRKIIQEIITKMPAEEEKG